MGSSRRFPKGSSFRRKTVLDVDWRFSGGSETSPEVTEQRQVQSKLTEVEWTACGGCGRLWTMREQLKTTRQRLRNKTQLSLELSGSGKL